MRGVSVCLHQEKTTAMCCCCSMKFWGVFLAAILGAATGFAVLVAVTPCYHDLFTMWTGHEIPWSQEEHHVQPPADGNTLGPDVLVIAHSLFDCLEESGKTRIAAYTLIGASIAVVLYIIIIFMCMCRRCCCGCHSKGGGERYAFQIPGDSGGQPLIVLGHRV